MKIVHFVPSIDRASGGVGSFIQLIAKELGRLVELHIITVHSSNELPLEFCKIHYIPSGILCNTRRVWHSIIEQLKPDVIHINCCWTPQCAFTQRWSQELGYRVVLTPHGMLEPWIIRRNYWSRKLPALILYQRRAIERADTLHATAQSERDNLLNLGYNDRIEVIPNGIDVEHIEVKRSWNKSRKILFLSRVHPKKGVEYLIEAASSLRRELEGYEIIIAGEGEPQYLSQLRSRASKLGVSHLFNFYGGVYGERKWELFREADLFILPTHSENFGIVVAEALACGTPVATTYGTPWRELASHHCGWYTPIGTAATIEVLRSLLSSTQSQLEEMGRNGRELINRRYSITLVAREMQSLYKRLLSI